MDLTYIIIIYRNKFVVGGSKLKNRILCDASQEKDQALVEFISDDLYRLLIYNSSSTTSRKRTLVPF